MWEPGACTALGPLERPGKLWGEESPAWLSSEKSHAVRKEERVLLSFTRGPNHLSHRFHALCVSPILQVEELRLRCETGLSVCI